MTEMRRFANKVHFDLDGKPLRVEWDKEEGNPDKGMDVVDIKTYHIFRLILNLGVMNGLPDAVEGGRLFAALKEAKGEDFIEIDVAVHTWIKAKAEPVVVKLWRINAVSIMDFLIDGYEKGDADAS